MVLELGASQNVAAADDDGHFAARAASLLDLAGDVDDLLHADSALSGAREAVAGEFEHNTTKGLNGGGG